MNFINLSAALSFLSIIIRASSVSDDSESDLETGLQLQIPETFSELSKTCNLFENSIPFLNLPSSYLDGLSEDRMQRLESDFSQFLSDLLGKLTFDTEIDLTTSPCASLFLDIVDHVLLKRRSQWLGQNSSENATAYAFSLGLKHATLKKMSKKEKYDVVILRTYLAAEKLVKSQASKKFSEMLFFGREDFLAKVIEATTVPSEISRQSAHSLFVLFLRYHRVHWNNSGQMEHQMNVNERQRSYGKALINALDYIALFHNHNDAIPYGLEYLLPDIATFFGSIKDNRYANQVLTLFLQLLSKILKNNFVLMITDKWKKAFTLLFNNIKARDHDQLSLVFSKVVPHFNFSFHFIVC